MALTPQHFQKKLLSWFDAHGRKELPWQQDKTPYRVWVSEIMLQQTQVATVIPYYLRFMHEFPTIVDLANADEDAVMHAWAGLGYYSRARNLHRAAKKVVSEFNSEFPDDLTGLQSLPGIGTSTAGAILALAFEKPATILDGNVKRVLTRLLGITSPINEKATENELWDIACRYTSQHRIADYTQAIMDFGATLCTRSKPNCNQCPFRSSCYAFKQDLVAEIPAKKATKKLPVKQATFLVLTHDKRVLLVKRPPRGIWGGLYSLPEIQELADANEIKTYCYTTLRLNISKQTVLPTLRHTFSHYHLDIHPVSLEVLKMPAKVMAEDNQIWYNLNQPDAIGLPKPIHTILRSLK